LTLLLAAGLALAFGADFLAAGFAFGADFFAAGFAFGPLF